MAMSMDFISYDDDEIMMMIIYIIWIMSIRCSLTVYCADEICVLGRTGNVLNAFKFIINSAL